MSPNPAPFLSHLRQEGYHPRSNKHSNALAQCVVQDLYAFCPAISDKARADGLVYDLNFELRTGASEWNVDLVLGEPALGPAGASSSGSITRQRPAFVQIAIEIKSIMTEHRKAVKNRKRDMEAHHEHVHGYNRHAIAAGVFVVNASPAFLSPLRSARTEHNKPARLVEHCVTELRNVASRSEPSGHGLDARCAIVVNMDNEQLEHTQFVTSPPAPGAGDPLHYDSFIRTVCDQYTRRFG